MKNENEIEECGINNCKSKKMRQPFKQVTIEKLAELFKAMSDPTRLKIIIALLNGEMCVIHIAETVEMSQSAVSHQLRNLKSLHIVKNRRDGKSMVYSLDDTHIEMILDMGIVHITHQHED